MAGDAEQEGSSLKQRSPGVQARASGANTFGKEREMNNTTALSVVTPETMPAISHAGRPVVTTALLAKLYGTEAKRIQNNYMRNADRFEQGKHFFKLEGKELTDLRPSMGGSQISAKARSLMLWTERGAARHAKMLETNEAWDVFERLEDCYFGTVETEKALSTPASQTLIGTTIGTDGFHCLAAVLDGKVRHLPADARRGAKNHIWSQVHKAFSVVTAEDIPASQLDSARNFIAAYHVQEGEWLPKEETVGTVLNDHQLYNVYFLRAHFKHLNDIFNRYKLYSHFSGIGSPVGAEMIDHFRDGHMAVHELGKLEQEFDAVQRRLGLNKYRGAGLGLRATA